VPNPVNRDIGSQWDEVLIVKDLNQSGHVTASDIRVENQLSIDIIFCCRELFSDRRESVGYEITRIPFLPVQETIKDMKAMKISNGRED
jgi:hypothetical protein